MYAAAFPDWRDHFILEDVHKLTREQLPTVDLATASFPCTDLSLAGGREGLAGKHSSAFWGFVEALARMSTKPKLVMLENVPGFLTSHRGADLKDALQALGTLGYALDAFLLDAAWFVPQSRQRLFVVGVHKTRSSLVYERPQAPVLCESPARTAALVNFILDHPELPWAIRSLPAPSVSDRRIGDVLEDLPDSSSEWWSEARVRYLLNQMSPKHLALARQMTESDHIRYGTVFRRIRNGRSMAELRNDGTAGCLRTPKGGSGRQILFVAGKGRSGARLLTPRECARLMGADDYPLTVPPNQALYGFGDAVCVPVIQWISENYLIPALHADEGRMEVRG